MSRKNAATCIFFVGMAVAIFSGSNGFGIAAGVILIGAAFCLLNFNPESGE